MRAVLMLLLLAADPAANRDTETIWPVSNGALQIESAGQKLAVSLDSPKFTIRNSGSIGASRPTQMEGGLAAGGTLQISYEDLSVGENAHLEAKLLLNWSPDESVLRKWTRFRLLGSSDSHLLEEIILEDLDVRERRCWTHGEPALSTNPPIILEEPQSHPVFLPGFFVGIEFPVSAARREGDRLLLACRPGLRMEPEVWYESRRSVFGTAAIGEEVRCFQRYIERHRPRPATFHVNYNSWWTSPVPYTEDDILKLMGVFEEKLFRPHGVPFDTFAIDLGWSNPRSLWEINPRLFPTGFARIGDAARKMRAELGLWISPSSYYPPALDNAWAETQGYESFDVPSVWDKTQSVKLLCLGGKRYREEFRAKLVERVGRDGVRHLKLDGCSLTCPASNHGHEPGRLSSDAIAAGFIAAVEAARGANERLWIETTCFGFNPSPWWLFHVNSLIGTFGDDAPAGRVPAPVNRESYTTARDYFNLQGAHLLPIPVGSQEVLGIVHQSPDPFLNDAVMTVMRGHRFLPLYVNPDFMNDARWSSLAALLKWARANGELLGETVPLLPASWQSGDLPHFTDQGIMPREPYGYAHARNNRGLVVLRNPWIAPAHYRVKLDARLGFSPQAEGLSAVAQYPEPRVYAERLRFGDVLDARLAPYETIVLALAPEPPAPGLPPAPPKDPSVKLVSSNRSLERVALDGPAESLGIDWTCSLADVDAAIRLKLDACVTVAAPQAELLVLFEGQRPLAGPVGWLKVDGRPAETSEVSSAAGWSATVLPAPEHWLFLRAPLETGVQAVSLEQLAPDDGTRVSAWVWTSKPGRAIDQPAALPQPERVSLDAAELIATTDLAGLPPATQRVQRPTERIAGAFLDALEPVSVTQGWGTLQKNRSVWGKPLRIGGRRFARGLGTHAPSKIVYALKREYRRFQTWAGPDQNTFPTVSFEVWVDGVKKWESGRLKAGADPVRVDLDISNAETLELVVGDDGDLSADHADWADARLLR